jgi:hypothetical protein
VAEWPTGGSAVKRYLLHHVLVTVGIVAFPLYFWFARRARRKGHLRFARQLRFCACLDILVYVAVAAAIWLHAT